MQMSSMRVVDLRAKHRGEYFAAAVMREAQELGCSFRSRWWTRPGHGCAISVGSAHRPRAFNAPIVSYQEFAVRKPRNRVVQVRRFGGPEELEVVDAPLPPAGQVDSTVADIGPKFATYS